MGEERVQRSARSLSMKCVVLMDDMCLQLNIDLKDDYLILVREGNNRALMLSSHTRYPIYFQTILTSCVPFSVVVIYPSGDTI